MKRGMRYVGIDMRADTILQFMWDAGLSELPVLDQAQRPVGLISLGELIAAGKTRGGEGGVPLALRQSTPDANGPCVRDIMAFGIATIHESLPLSSAAARMLRSERECLVVVDDHGAAVGSLAMPDIMRWLLEQTGLPDPTLHEEPVTPGIVELARRHG
jgi:CBS-domain-containing membrane protein